MRLRRRHNFLTRSDAASGPSDWTGDASDALGITDAAVAALASKRYWLGTTSADSSDTANWSGTDGGAGGASLPGVNDTAYFTSSGNNLCTFGVAHSVTSLIMESGHTAKVDMNTYDLTVKDGNFTLAGSGEFDCGAGALTFEDCNSNWGADEFRNGSGWEKGTAKVWVKGTCQHKCCDFTEHYDFEIISGATYTNQVSCASPKITNTLTVYGTWDQSAYGNLTITGELRIKSGGTITGASGKQTTLTPATATDGLLEMAGTFSTGVLYYYTINSPGVDFPSGTYATEFNIYHSSLSNKTFTFAAGVHTFNRFSVHTGGVGTILDLVVDTDTNNADIVVKGELRTNLGRTCLVDFDSGGDWEIQGAVNLPQGSSANLTWSKGPGTITFTGSADQDVNFNSKSVEDIVINKTAGTVKIVTHNLDADSLTLTAGAFDTNGLALTTVNDLTINDDLVDPAGSIVNVGGNFSAVGQSGDLVEMLGLSTWTLNVTGTTTANYVNVSYSNATGTAVSATNSTNGGNNTNWSFP